MLSNSSPGIGHNQGPSLIDHAAEVSKMLSAWMTEHPVVSNEDDARSGKVLCDAGTSAVADIETERRGKVDPLNKQVKDINESYRPVRFTLESTLQGLLMRLDEYAKAEEARRVLEAAEKIRIADEAERKAREAEDAEQKAKESASEGVLGVDIATSTSNADAAFTLFKKAKREATRAVKNTKVRIGGGHRRALSLREKETLTVDSWESAISCMGLTDGIRDAILTAARSYRAEFSELPEGISAHHDRSL